MLHSQISITPQDYKKPYYSDKSFNSDSRLVECNIADYIMEVLFATSINRCLSLYNQSKTLVFTGLC